MILTYWLGMIQQHNSLGESGVICQTIKEEDTE